jgi:acyl carrier protein
MVDTVEQVIQEYIRREFLAEKPEILLTNELPLLQQGIIDSLGIFLLAGFVEERFGVEISEEDVLPENFASVNSIKDLLTVKLTQKISV